MLSVLFRPDFVDATGVFVEEEVAVAGVVVGHLVAVGVAAAPEGRLRVVLVDLMYLAKHQILCHNQ